MTILDDQKLGDLTVGELKKIIREVIFDLVDPDRGLELKAEIEEELIRSLKSKDRTSVEDLSSELGLKW